jgi:hypothetical protein
MEYAVPDDEERVRVCTGHGREGAVKRLGTARLHALELDAQRLGRSFRLPHIEGVSGMRGIPEEGHAGEGGEQVLEELQLFPAEVGGQGSQSGDVAPRPGEAGDEAAPHRIAHAHHHNGDRRGRVLGGPGRWRPIGHDDLHRETDPLSREGREPLVLPFCPTVLQDEVLAFDIAARAHPLQERPHIGVSSWGRLKQHTEAVHVRRRLRLRGERRHAEAAESDGDEEPDDGALHSGPLTSVPGSS